MSKLFGYREFHFDFLSRRWLWYIIALAAIVPGLLVALFAGMNQGIDFTGGSIIKIEYTEAVELTDVRAAVTDVVAQTPAVNEAGGNAFVIRTEALTDADSAKVMAALESLGPLNQDATEGEFIGPTIGAELLRNARMALLIAGLLMLAYITIRFRFNFAITSLAALIHDVLVIISVFSIFRIEINSAFVAAILTTVGYSINNTIVIFDRIRENQPLYGRKEFSRMINDSINQTLTRTINTVLAVLILLLTLLIFGGETTRSFVLALSVGMVAGFFSSVFLVGNFLSDIEKRFGSGLSGGKKGAASGGKRKVQVKRAAGNAK